MRWRQLGEEDAHRPSKEQIPQPSQNHADRRQAPSHTLPRFLTHKTVKEDTQLFFKPLSFGAPCYAAIDNRAQDKAASSCKKETRWQSPGGQQNLSRVGGAKAGVSRQGKGAKSLVLWVQWARLV